MVHFISAVWCLLILAVWIPSLWIGYLEALIFDRCSRKEDAKLKWLDYAALHAVDAVLDSKNACGGEETMFTQGIYLIISSRFPFSLQPYVSRVMKHRRSVSVAHMNNSIFASSYRNIANKPTIILIGINPEWVKPVPAAKRTFVPLAKVTMEQHCPKTIDMIP
ncbi:uncharacterized protein TrAFT101_003179 [Trichoderma asperellum]|uniref:uncharacterized protein n=1 Tax=Trichoderma asperellum TaxID=101201 RepID=UPI0033257239|nr:hypothetical protein TrAFT101_003179 [Trichoderma asperellum]